MKKILILFFGCILLYSMYSFTINLYNYKIQKIISNTPSIINCDASCKTDDVNELMQYALDYTTNTLEFKLNSSGNMDINSISDTKTANCIGYVTYYNAVLYKLLRDNHINNIKLQHARGIILFNNTDVHEFFTDPSFKNHDFSVITFPDNTVYFVDPSLSEMGVSLIIKQTN